ncbi:tyrosine-type recombinase/integrase [Devosia sp. YIM 151766]|uniref:tyrosine-type recombinase/integrase n=1 Tax=Devosia sp. YIM 151766 TaxID=3017325 RepID=UPI00255CBA29|nr:site-specific integrase [Devosia sp. YIM 151766]WIY52432.1 tyrosine-type recombinase/integrase [Devosia sp. YIM 151766]
MTSRTRLTEKLVRAAEPRSGDYQIFDNEVLAFALVIYPSGTKAFNLSYRVSGRQRRIVIGRWPDWSVVAARERAKELRRAIDMGADPMDERQQVREAPRISDLIDRYIEEHLPRLAPRNAADQTSMLRNRIEPEWKSRLVEDITPADVEKLLTRIAQGRARPHKANPKRKRSKPLAKPKPTPIRANRVGEVLRKMFTLAVQWKMRDDNPATSFRKRIEIERERFLSPDEISRLAEALAAVEDQRGATIIRLCLLTGARLGEVRCARFEQFNLDLLSWSKPAATTKQRRIHRLPISKEVAAIVRLRRTAVGMDCAWLFPGDAADKDQPVQDLKRFWRNIQKDADLPDVRIHDLRHTFASLLVSGGASLEMIGKLLGHTQYRTTQRYAHLLDGPLRAGVNAVADMVKPRLRVIGGAEQER